jgi:multiple sugar transport system ATP-binding protein
VINEWRGTRAGEGWRYFRRVTAVKTTGTVRPPTFHYGSSGTYLPVKGQFVMATVTYDSATRIYPGTDRPAVDRLDLEIGDGEFLVLVGPSGCGKSTSLRMLAGLEDIDEGSVLIGDRDVTYLPPKDRDIAMVFQNYALYPHMTVAENMGFALKIAGVPKAQIKERVRDAAELLHLEDYLDRKPKALSGGQRQRVAMGRAIVRQPQVFLMDEPLSNLDAKLRVQTRTQIAKLQRDLGVTTVYVTHDQVEAMTMGDRVAVLKDGVLQQVDRPRAMYDRPANVFVAGFIGSPAMNLHTVPLADGGVQYGDVVVPIPRETVDAAKNAGDTHVTIGVRPESFEPITASGEGVAVEVTVVEELGADAFMYGTAKLDDTDQQIIVRADSRRPPEKGSIVHLRVRPGEQHVFSASTGERLG